MTPLYVTMEWQEWCDTREGPETHRRLMARHVTGRIENSADVSVLMPRSTESLVRVAAHGSTRVQLPAHGNSLVVLDKYER